MVEIGEGVSFAEELNMNALVVNDFVSSDVPKRGKDKLGGDGLPEGRGGKSRIVGEDGRGEGLRRGGEEINEGVEPNIPAEGRMGAAHAKTFVDMDARTYFAPDYNFPVAVNDHGVQPYPKP
jgi:hypothetical protein